MKKILKTKRSQQESHGRITTQYTPSAPRDHRHDEGSYLEQQTCELFAKIHMKLRRSVILVAAATTTIALSLPANSMTISKAATTNDHVVVVGLNGALQKRFILPHRQSLVPGNVHRAATVDFGVGGKGQDVAIALHCLLNESPIQLLQFLGNGFAGDTVYNLLRECLGDTAMGLTVRTISELRTCTSIIASDETTELVEPSGMIASDELDQLFSLLSLSNGNSARALCIMGSMPPGCPEDTYARIYAHVVGKDTVCVLDSLAGIMPLLHFVSQNKDRVGPLVVKVNASELCKLAGTSKSSSEIGGITLDELMDAIHGFLAKYPTAVYETATKSDDGASSTTMTGVIGLAITDGKHDAYFVGIQKNENNQSHNDDTTKSRLSYRVFQMPVPKLETNQNSRPLYPIGAGGKKSNSRMIK